MKTDLDPKQSSAAAEQTLPVLNGGSFSIEFALTRYDVASLQLRAGAQPIFGPDRFICKVGAMAFPTFNPLLVVATA